MSDLPVTTVPGQSYGRQAEQRRAQQAVPMSAPPQIPPPPRLGDPTARPAEPVQTGLSTGPGAGPEALGVGPSMSGDRVTVETLRALYRKFPSPALERMIIQKMSR